MENQRIKKAKKFLKSARTLLETGDYDSCISRSYYALFHAAISLLEKFGIMQGKWEHGFVLAEWNKQFVHRRKVFKPEMVDDMYKIFYQRNEADYNAEEKSSKKAKRMLDKTEAIFNTVLKEVEREKP